MQSKIDLTNIELLREASKQLTSDQLITAQQWVEGLIQERHENQNQRIGDRNLKQMRGLMAKAGISWEEFQKAL